MAVPDGVRSEEGEDGPGTASGGAAADPAGLASLLELPTKLVTVDRPGWWLSVYPDALEAGGCFRGSIGARDSVWDGEDDRDADGQRARIEAARRARGQVRRFAAANRLNRLGTLTYRGEGCHDPKQIRADLGRFFRQLRREVGGASFPYLWVPEWHPGGHGLHAHFAVGRFIGRRLIERAWPHGFVHIKLLGNLPVGSGTVEEARRAARYLGKYVSKDPAAGSGLHRYEVAQGYQPRVEKVWGRTMPEAIAAASELIGAEPEYVWNSDGVEGWAGPPAGWVSWPG